MFPSPVEEGWLYWVRWQVPVCALVIAIPSVFALKFIRKSMAEPLLLSDLWATHWRRLSPLWLLLYRAFAFVCCVQLLYEIVALHGPFVFFFYTQWTMALVAIYFALGTIVSAYGYWYPSRKTQSKNEEGSKLLEKDLKKNKIATSRSNGDNVVELQNKYAQQEKAGYLGTLMQMSYLASAGASVLTDVVFWCLLVPFLLGENFQVNLLIGSIHTLNAVFLLGDTALNSLSFPVGGFAYFVVFGGLYVVFQWSVHACCVNWWPYPFFELSTPWAPLWYFALAVIHIPCYGLYALIVKAKYSLLPRLFPRAFVKSF
ncbi:uncharacterized protein LOC111025507 [Momordica charantia]|uniref:Uncharacterized protein LOC111025507 n=1 Tax=Momordica charantia TaxID=3673 RepID=A0A6J1DXS9_MOMCH|nr:uncharacterized protein LOC111025507 [Momordica charantia]